MCVCEYVCDCVCDCVCVSVCVCVCEYMYSGGRVTTVGHNLKEITDHESVCVFLPQGHSWPGEIRDTHGSVLQKSSGIAMLHYVLYVCTITTRVCIMCLTLYMMSLHYVCMSSVPPLYYMYMHTQGIVLVYDVTKERTFTNVSKWLRNIEEVSDCTCT